MVAAGGSGAAVWRTESNAVTQATMLSVGVAIGALLVYACRPGGASDGNRTAGLVLGLVLLAGGAAGFVLTGRQVVVVDPVRRVVTTERSNRFGTKTSTFGFDEIAALGVQSVAGYNGVPSYCVTLRLHDGRRAALFVGFFGGQFSQRAMEERRRRLERYLDP